MVQPDPTPASVNLLKINKENLGGSNQNEKLLSRGKAISAHPNIRGSNQLLKPPIKTGMTKKKIIINPCAVIRTLYVASESRLGPPLRSSVRIAKLITVPTSPDPIPNKKYNLPMSL